MMTVGVSSSQGK
jgi:hypothetical protein